MQEYRVYTAHGDWYIINELGQVLEYSNGLNKRGASPEQLNTWRINGAWSAKGRVDLAELLSWASLDFGDKRALLTLKNGKPRWGLRDIDHGTQRECGNKDVHGINDITRL